eukprot:4465386-Prymnesium_polylepis.1
MLDEGLSQGSGVCGVPRIGAGNRVTRGHILVSEKHDMDVVQLERSRSRLACAIFFATFSRREGARPRTRGREREGQPASMQLDRQALSSLVRLSVSRIVWRLVSRLISID